MANHDRTKRVIKILKANQDETLEKVADLISAAGIKTKYGTDYNRASLISLMGRYYRVTRKVLHPGYSRRTKKRSGNSKSPTVEGLVVRKVNSLQGSDSDKVALAHLILDSRVGESEKLRMLRAVVS